MPNGIIEAGSIIIPINPQAFTTKDKRLSLPEGAFFMSHIKSVIDRNQESYLESV